MINIVVCILNIIIFIIIKIIYIKNIVINKLPLFLFFYYN
jgi:hypothetical protein